MNTSAYPLRLNVGFVAHQPVGYTRKFDFTFPSLTLDPDLALQDFTMQATFSRTYQGLLAQIEVQATSEVQCVRCLTSFQQPLQADFTELYAFTPRSTTESDLILPEDGNIDLAPLAREYLLLEIPISPTCKTDCRGLCPVCGENRNTQLCQHDIEDIDPRLAPLKPLLTD